MTDPLERREELHAALNLAAREAHEYLSDLGSRRVLDPGVDEALADWGGPLPEAGDGAMVALGELIDRARPAAMRSSGPRFFHFVMGGTTPAALGADWLTSTLDQVAFGWASSPLASVAERIATGWLRDLFELPDDFAGTLVTGATMANFTGLTAARSWWAERQGVDVERAGLTGLPQPVVLTSGYIHPSAEQAVGMLGLGRASIRRLARDATGRLDLEALERELASLDDAPAIVIANAGEVNAGDFDPIAEVADLTEEHGAWLHVDGAFGLFARLSPQTRHLTEGVERAQSIAADAHKWLNVPYDCGFAFVREPARLVRAFVEAAPYLPPLDDPRPNPGYLTPENSRRARAFAVWATLRAYGREGHRAMVERHLGLARHLGERVDAAPELERLAEVKLNIVCFRARPEGVPEAGLDELNRELGEALLRDGRVFAGTTTYEGRVAFRPAIVNWQTTEPDVELLVEVLLELLRGRNEAEHEVRRIDGT
jgi:glutamate/tyrosine decarboxylase-like PLP-dependent enzyme